MQRRTPWQLPLALALAALAGAWLAPAGPAVAQEATPAPTPEAPAEDEDDARLTALGGAMAAECYTACGFVGALADGFRAGTYDKTYVRVRLGGVKGMVEVNLQQLKQLRRQVQLTPADHKALTAFQGILEGLIQQCDALSAYAEKGEAGKAKSFRAARERTWRQLANTVGFGDATSLLEPGGANLGEAK